MQTPMSIADLANMMELDQGLLNKAALNGLDPSKLVSIKDFVNALGLDAGKVTAELTMLQQKLPVDGIASYVERAKAMGLKAASTPNTAESLAPQKPNSDAREPIPGIAPATSLPDSISSAIEIPVPMELSGQMAPMNSPAQVSGNTKSANAQMPGQNPAGLSQVGRQRSGMTEDPADLLMRQALLSGKNIIRQDLQQGAAMTSNPVLPTEMPNSNNSSSLLNSTKPLDLQLPDEGKIISDMDAGLTLDLSTESANATKDPFAVIGQMMDNQSKLNIEFGGDGLTQRSLQEHLLANGLETSSLKKDSVGETIVKTLEETPSSSASNFGIDPLTDLRFNSDFTVARENLNAATQAATVFGGSAFSEGDSQEGDASQDFAGQFSDRATDAASAMTSGAQTTHDANGIFAEKLSNAPKTNTASPIAAKILGHAQMMFKNGGGSMSVNVEAPGIGKVDVAINLINNQLDVRIITASDQARDMISKEIAGLRDGLTQQGISLRGLEVGKAGDSSPRHFAGQGQQQFGQGARDQQATYNDMREYVQSCKNTYIPRAGSEAASSVAASTRWSNAAKPLLGDKRVEIRV
jgi:flagellar hook-length control protein FliK